MYLTAVTNDSRWLLKLNEKIGCFFYWGGGGGGGAVGVTFG